MLKITSVLLALAIGSLANAIVFADCLRSNSSDSDFPESVVYVNDSSSIQSAWYDDATDRYAHGVLGDAIEPSTLMVNDEDGCTRSVVLDQAHVFEDLAPRLADIDGNGDAELITIRSHQNYGAQIAIYQLAGDALKLLTSTPYIGTSNRWLAPVGVADLNNDGDMDIAYIDRPHLAKTLRIWSYRNGNLEQITNKTGYTNHRIGEPFITGGLKTCAEEITMITVDSRWNHILETTLKGDQLTSENIGTFNGPESIRDALRCQ